MQGDIAFIITESNNDSGFKNSHMKIYACIKAHERNFLQWSSYRKKKKGIEKEVPNRSTASH